MNKPQVKRTSLRSQGENIPLCLSVELRTITTLPLASQLIESVLDFFKGKPELNEEEVFRIVKVLKYLNYLKNTDEFRTGTWPPPSFASDGSYTTQIQALIPLTACKYSGIVHEALCLSITSLSRLSHEKMFDCLQTGFLTPFQGTRPNFAAFSRTSMYSVMSLISCYLRSFINHLPPITQEQPDLSSKQIIKRIFTQIVKPLDHFLRFLFLHQSDFRDDIHSFPFYELLSLLIVSAPYSNAFTQFLVSRPLCLMWMTCMNLSTLDNGKSIGIYYLAPLPFELYFQPADTERRRKDVLRQLREEGYEDEVGEWFGWMGSSSLLKGLVEYAQRILVGMGGNVPRDRIVPYEDGDETDEEEGEEEGEVDVGEVEVGEEEGAGTEGKKKKKKKTRRRRRLEKTKKGRKEMILLQESRKD
ncbi:hypothetical protein BLNAU_5096 [Blattamonas nauphoetae]|uniref:Uncharacterized protein n=1 Tax=Blattamonas nauphoetae TaxID=2049346 RepID=A0ABQ9Y8A1_9EUKA|nr:hypothetical protein BLNAU_5096 [Blattamonas nauphoetae]